jgi:hypothetical protein
VNVIAGGGKISNYDRQLMFAQLFFPPAKQSVNGRCCADRIG